MILKRFFVNQIQNKTAEHSPKAWDKIVSVSLEDNKSKLMPLKSMKEKGFFLRWIIWEDIKTWSISLTHENKV